MKKYNISVQKVGQSKLSGTNFNDLAFGKVFSDHMFIADYKNGEWSDCRIVPYGKMEFMPALMSFHYGQAVFEGMKAVINQDGTPLFFRPEMHAKRLNLSANRLGMPSVPEELFQQALDELVALDANWIPNAPGALYLRPFMIATDEFIGVRASDTYRFMIFTCPVGAYYPKPVKLLVSEKYVRAFKGGVGEAKAAGNYAATILPAKEAQDAGYDQLLWLDGAEFKYIHECGTMNMFFVIDDVVITPETDGAILKGITRDSLLTILKDKGYKVEVRAITIDEVVEAYRNGTLQEAFGAGTAAVVANVSEITYKGERMDLNPVSNHKVAIAAKQAIQDIRDGKAEDKHGWLKAVSIKQPV